MLSIYERMVNRIKRQFPAAHDIGRASIIDGNVEVEFTPFTNCDDRYTLVYYGGNNYEIIRHWSIAAGIIEYREIPFDAESLELEKNLKMHGGQELGFIPGTGHL